MLSKVNLILMACLVWIGGAAIFSAAAADSRSLSFNDGWRFTLADSPEMANRNLTIHHGAAFHYPMTGLSRATSAKTTRQAQAVALYPAESDGIARRSLSRRNNAAKTSLSILTAHT